MRRRLSIGRLMVWVLAVGLTLGLLRSMTETGGLGLIFGVVCILVVIPTVMGGLLWDAVGGSDGKADMPGVVLIVVGAIVTWAVVTLATFAEYARISRF